jgi:ankyrin repeat protein
MTLFEAVAAGDVEAARAALADGADVNELGPERSTPLIVAAGQGRLELVELLLEHGAEPECRDAAHETALLKAAANGHADVVRLLIPSASEDDADLARSFLAAFGQSHGPEYQVDETRFGALKRKAAVASAKAADFVGYSSPQQRVARVERAEAKVKKKP